METLALLLLMSLIPTLVALDSDQQVLCVQSVLDAVLAGDYIYSSPLWCQTQCAGKGKFPYIAMKNGGECYCLKLKPLGLLGSCNVPCKGFGTMNCGGLNAYGIFANPDVPDTGLDLQLDLLDTTTSSTSTATTSSSSATTTSPTTTTTSSPTTASSTSDTAARSDDAATTSHDASPLTYTLIYTALTLGNSVVTITQTLSIANPTSLALASALALDSDKNKKKSSTNVGAIVGGVVGGVGGAIVIALMAFFFIRWRRQLGDDEEDYEYGGEKFDDVPALGRGNTAKGSKRLRNGALDMPMTNPFDHPLDAHAVGGVRPPALPDPRLNPVMMGRRRLSEGSLADDADYSRKILHVANPE